MVGLSFQVLPFPVNQFCFSGGSVSPHINDDSIEVFCKMLMDAIKVNPEARPVIISGSPGIPVVTGQSSLSRRAKPLEILG
jgi:hypothetical protein